MPKPIAIRDVPTRRPRLSLAGEALRAVHAEPKITRTELAHRLGMSSGVAADTVRRLVSSELLIEGPAIATGARGRPTRSLGPHPRGPLAAVAAVAHESWEVAAIELGGGILDQCERPHARNDAKVLGDVALALRAVCERYHGRVRAIAISVPGTVSGTRLAQAPNLGWRDVDLLALRPPEAAALPLLAGNDATFSAVAEARRGAAVGATSSVHIYMDSGVGGAIIDAGRVVLGANGRAGEFGHMPFGQPDALCRCGARGCWNTILDGTAWAGALGCPSPVDEVSFSRSVLNAARAACGPETRIVEHAAAGLGRGIAGLVNALDPEIVTVGGLAREIAQIAGDRLDRAYREGLMAAIAAHPPPIVSCTLRERAPLFGAAEQAFDVILQDL
ncbi:MAG: ROK family transcriptional regulator [Solirubrobacteraceae bacterium]